MAIKVQGEIAIMADCLAGSRHLRPRSVAEEFQRRMEAEEKGEEETEGSIAVLDFSCFFPLPISLLSSVYYIQGREKGFHSHLVNTKFFFSLQSISN